MRMAASRSSIPALSILRRADFRTALGTPAFPGQVLFNDVAGSIGNIPRNAFDGPGYFNIDASLFKTIKLTETVRLQLRAEAFNLLNHTNFAITNQYRNISTAGNYNLTVTFPPRVIQFAGRLEF